jgi:hypothetical protein
MPIDNAISNGIFFPLNTEVSSRPNESLSIQ